MIERNTLLLILIIVAIISLVAIIILTTKNKRSLRELKAWHCHYAEGSSFAYGELSHAKGRKIYANDNAAHSECNGSIADAYVSHAEGTFNTRSQNIIFTGGRSVALGKDAKLVPAGICTNSDILPEEEKRNDPFNPINRCIFCGDGNHCYFAGECENRKPLEG